MSPTEIIYLDNNSTTQVDPRVVDAMLPFLTNVYGNASSTHSLGKEATKQVKNSRQLIADLLNCDPLELTFTSGSTESINLALSGYALQNQHKGKHIVSIKTEHKAVLDTLKHLESIGFEVTLLETQSDGMLDLQILRKAIRKDTLLVSAMWSNNEIGTMHPIKDITDIVHEQGSVIFCDATQAVGKISIDLRDVNVDMLSFSAHKFHGPKGVGALFVKMAKGKRKILQPIQFGGGHEGGLRSGTLNTPGIVGLATALQLSSSRIPNDIPRIKRLRDELEEELLKVPNSFVNGTTQFRIYNTTNICFPGLDANVFVEKMSRVAVSNGSACSAAIIEPSHVLRSLGLSDEFANASIRFSLSRFNTEVEVGFATRLLKDSISREILKYA
jgi:cysteine desulfurase